MNSCYPAECVGTLMRTAGDLDAFISTVILHVLYKVVTMVVCW